MSKFLLQDEKFFINKECSILDIPNLAKLTNNKQIQEIVVNCEIDQNVAYFLLLKGEAGVSVSAPSKILTTIKNLHIIKIAPFSQRQLPQISLEKAPKILIPESGNERQELFWRKTFLSTLNLCFFQNAFFFCSVMFFCGFSTLWLTRKIFLYYGIEMELIRVTASGWIDIGAPLLTSIMIIAKFSTAMSAMIKFKDINYELKTLRLFGISIFSDYMHAIVFGCCASAIATQIFGTLCAMIGSSLAWKLSGHSIYMYFHDAMHHIYPYHLFVSFTKTLLSSVWIGTVVCVSGLTEGRSVVSIFLSVEKMVVWALWGVVIIQIMLNLLII